MCVQLWASNADAATGAECSLSIPLTAPGGTERGREALVQNGQGHGRGTGNAAVRKDPAFTEPRGGQTANIQIRK